MKQISKKKKKTVFIANTINEGDGLELLKNLNNNCAKLIFFDPQYSKVKDVIKVHQAPMIYQAQTNINEFLSEISRVLQPNGWRKNNCSIMVIYLLYQLI